MKTVSVQTIASTIKRKFKIEMDIYEIVENSAEVLKKMGMLATKRSFDIYVASNYCVKMPPETHKIVSAIQLEPYILPTNVNVQEIYHPPLQTLKNEVISTQELSELTVESTPAKMNYIWPVKGPYVDFIWDCPYVRFNFTDFKVGIESTSIPVDGDGYPLIPEEALNACVYYNVYTYMEPIVLTGRIPLQVFKEVEGWKDKHINQSKNRRYFDELSRNEVSKYFDIFTSMDRKRTNIPM